tara:strand:+ start:680 stop:940 length:261 start_codon:yes stop_codon:yes gene_type:complete
MALTETTELDQIEVVSEYKMVQVRNFIIIKKDGTEISRTYSRYVLQPDNDISNEPDEVKAICNAVWTDDVKDAWTKFQQSSVYFEG